MSFQARKLTLPVAATIALAVAAIHPGSLMAGQSKGPKTNEGSKMSEALAESSSRADKKGNVPSTSKSSPPPATAEFDPNKYAYRIGVEDELQISVWREPELTQVVVVRPDGVITLPLLSDVRVVGLKPEELQALLTEKLKPFVNEPQVTVIARVIRSRKVYLVGQAVRPGAFPLNGRKTILELLSEAGGLGPFAKAGSIYVLRKDEGKDIRINFNYKKALSGRGENIELLPGDMVIVP